MYHIRIDYSESQTLYEFDYADLTKVIESVTSQYLLGNMILFSGTRLQNQYIRQVIIYETSNDIISMKHKANANIGRYVVSSYSRAYTRADVLKDNLYSKDITRDVMEQTQQYIKHVRGESKEEKEKVKKHLLFISHSSANENIATNLVQLLRTLGFNNKNLFCSSVPGYDIKEGEDIYDTLASKFQDYNIFVIFLLSSEYYQSAACLNEMGATWVLKANYSTIVCPGFSIPEIKGAINPSKMAVVLEDNKRVNGKLNNLKDRLIEFFGLLEVEDDTIWENDRNKFIESI